MTSWRWSPAWTVERDRDRAVLSAGADHRYALTDVDRQEQGALRAWAAGATIEGHSDLADTLRTLGVLVPDAPTGRPLAWTLEHPLAGAIQAAVANLPPAAGGRPVLVRSDADLALVVRDGPTTPAVPAGPHLLVDVATHHTLSLGPYVVPGDTACLGCLDERVRLGWGEAAVPPEPAAGGYVALVAALVATELRAAADGAPTTVNATAAFDLRTGARTDHRLLRVPWCPLCGEGPRPGGLDLSAVGLEERP
ncbi:MAG: TOMM precursor leader peptide-binding protein [Actinobacteria bacterium]|nr:TOMM precursor leader peptide-binding protein [Actinomycetota bacterium]